VCSFSHSQLHPKKKRRVHENGAFATSIDIDDEVEPYEGNGKEEKKEVNGKDEKTVTVAALKYRSFGIDVLTCLSICYLGLGRLGG